MKISLIALITLSLAITTPAISQDTRLLKQALPNAIITDIQPTNVGKLYEVLVDGQIIYLSEDGQYAVYGAVIDLKNKVNVTDNTQSALRAKILESVPTSEMIIFSPKKPLYTVTIFTDPECQWCRKLHSEINDYMARGIEIRYLAYPRSGPTESAAQTLASVWCSHNPHEALSAAMRGQQLSPGTCDNPVARHYELGERFGVTGTPAIILSSGQLLPGYATPDELLRVLSGV